MTETRAFSSFIWGTVSDSDLVRERVILLESFPLKIIPSATSRNGLFFKVGGLYTSLQLNVVIVRNQIAVKYLETLMKGWRFGNWAVRQADFFSNSFRS